MVVVTHNASPEAPLYDELCIDARFTELTAVSGESRFNQMLPSI